MRQSLQARRLGGSDRNGPHAGEGPPVRAVSGRGNVAGPRESSSETIPAARAMMALQLVWLAPESPFRLPSLHNRQ